MRTKQRGEKQNNTKKNVEYNLKPAFLPIHSIFANLSRFFSPPKKKKIFCFHSWKPLKDTFKSVSLCMFHSRILIKAKKSKAKGENMNLSRELFSILSFSFGAYKI